MIDSKKRRCLVAYLEKYNIFLYQTSPEKFKEVAANNLGWTQSKKSNTEFKVGDIVETSEFICPDKRVQILSINPYLNKAYVKMPKTPWYDTVSFESLSSLNAVDIYE